MTNLPKKIWRFYYEGFRNMPSWGRNAWMVIIIKLFIMFAILMPFFFRNHLNKKFENDKQKGDYVIEQMTKDRFPKKQN